MTPSYVAIRRFNVAPRAGAWVETRPRMDTYQTLRSHPVRVRGLKLMAGIVAGLTYPSHPVRVRGLKQISIMPAKPCQKVAPRAGAWVETYDPETGRKLTVVAPRAGAWVETTPGVVLYG